MTKRLNRNYVETPRVSDLIYTGASTIANIVPGVGELFKFLFEEPITKRKLDWIESLEKRITELETTISDIKIRIKNNENAVSATFYASALAVKTTDKIKLEALQNIIINAALNPNFDGYKIQMFLSFVDSFTEWHIKILKFFHDPKTIADEHKIKIISGEFQSLPAMYVFWKLYPDMSKNSDYVKVIIDNLYNSGLINVDGSFLTKVYSYRAPLGIFNQEFGPLTKHTTDLGNELLLFISNNQTK